MTINELRQLYLDFFKARGHAVIPSASLLPEHDPTTLFTGSGMQPLLPYLLGEEHPSGKRLVNSQKCFRSQDMEQVGDNRHTIFFEMLGNWSLGEYFKEEQIPWFFSFLTDSVGLDPKHLYVTCFRGNKNLDIPKDEESSAIWRREFASKGIDAHIIDFPERDGMKDGRIFYYDEKKNWWSRAGEPENMPIGEPGGPDTEVFWDFGHALGMHEQSQWRHLPCHVNCDCGRFLEIGNSVFMEYQKTANGFTPLPQKNVDFGGGLERIAAAKANNPDIFAIDIFEYAKKTLVDESKKNYSAGVASDVYAFRVVLDHVRAAIFLIHDGAYPSNKDQGYFVRRLIRRAVRFSHTLGIEKDVCASIASSFIEAYKDSYPKLGDGRESILEEIRKEEKKFRHTITQGIKKFNESAKSKIDSHISGVEAFDLYQSYGFPFELTEEMAKERHFSIDREGFEREKEKHQNISRQGMVKKFHGGLSDHSEMSIKYHTATHLLHAAVLQILGQHATQRGSNITPDRLRFDFSHPQALTETEKQSIENLVNSAIARDYPVSFQVIPIEEAKRLRAIGLFEETYGDMVKIYTIGDPHELSVADSSMPTFSREFCGGPHVSHTGILGKFTIKKEESIGAGLRRIRAILA